MNDLDEVQCIELPITAPLWIPVAYAVGCRVDGAVAGFEYRGQPVSNKREAWAIARRMCDELEHGGGFSVQRLDETGSHFTQP